MGHKQIFFALFLAILWLVPAQEAQVNSSRSNEETRKANRPIVVKFFQLPISDERVALYADDGQKELKFTDVVAGKDIRWNGMAALKANTEFNKKMFPNLKWHNVHVWSTQDPNYYWVEADASWTRIPAPGADPITISRHYMISMQTGDGKLKHQREFSVPLLVPFTQPSISEQWSSDDAVRSNGHAIAAKYFQLPFGDEQTSLFADDAVKEILGTGKQWTGRAALQSDADDSKDALPGWKWFNVQIWDTQDANFFWIEADGSGTRVPAPGADPMEYGGHFLFTIEIKGGKISHLRGMNLNNVEPMIMPVVYAK